MVDQKTISTYNSSAELVSEHFKGVGSRVSDIEKALELAACNRDAAVIEIGCGDGRDAEEIVRRVGAYAGFDPSEGLLEIARRRLPATAFSRSDALGFNYPKNIDVVFAFASLLHSPVEDVQKAFIKVHDSLRPGGVFMISLKEREEYESELVKDLFGERLFYYYNEALLSKIAGDGFSKVYEAHHKIGKTDWLKIAFERMDT